MHRNSYRAFPFYFLLTLLAIGLTACGGGASDSNGDSLQSQTLSFSDPSPPSIVVGQQLANPASATGSGAISYTSSNPTIASINSSGTVTANDGGNVTITATIAADDTYDAANTNYSLTVTAPLSLGFTLSGPLALVVGDVTSNEAISPSAGAITYSSSNAAIADVDVNGQVTAYAAGSVTITADQVADGAYSADSVNYQVDVVTASFTLTTWIGENSSLVDFSADTDGIEFYRSSDGDCDISNYALCADGQLNVLNSTTVIDTAATTSQTGFYTFKHGTHQVNTKVSNQVFSKRTNTAVVEFNGQLFMSGGNTGGLDCANDVWSSGDGATWTELTNDAAFAKRDNHQMVAFNNKLWIVGGKVHGYVGNCNTPVNDVWYSEDGVTWTQATANAGFTARHNHALVTFNNKLWVVGGVDASNVNTFNDVWSSSDGINWTQETAAAAFSPRQLHNVDVLNGTLYLVGGQNGSVLKDTWSSTDGVNWIQEIASATYNRADAMTVHDNKLWIMNFTYGGKNEIWYSSDGISWTKKILFQKFASRYWPVLTSFDNKLWFIGGRSLGSKRYNDVWYTTSAANEWLQAAPGADYPLRYGHAGVSFNNKIWVISGFDGYYLKNDIWSTTDGVTWTEEVATTPFPARYQHKVIEFNNKLWLFGGRNASIKIYDQWSSDDGVSWTQETPDTILTNRYAYQLVVFNSKLWLFGGRSRADDSHLDEVWSTTDGLSWTQETPATFPERADTRIFEYNNTLWMVGGSDSSWYYRNDVWSSTDGLSWTQVNAAAPFSSRTDPQYFVLNNKLWMVGGGTETQYTKFNDIWSTTDGITWTEENSSAAFTARDQHPLVELNGQFWILGGYQWTDIVYKDIWTTTDGINWRTPLQKTVTFP